MSDEELNNLLESGDITNVFNSSRNISPFRTVLFPNDERVMKLFGKIWEKGEKAIEKGEKPTYPTINLNRFEVDVFFASGLTPTRRARSSSTSTGATSAMRMCSSASVC